MKEYYLRLNSLCDANCIFCETRTSKIEFKLKKKLDLILELKRQGYNKIIITWWEPTIYFYKMIFLVKFCLKLWFRVSLQTNWLSSNNIDIAKKITSLNFDDIMISFHSHKKYDFEYIYQKTWSFEKICTWIDNLLKLRNNIFINIVVNRENKDYITDILFFLNKRFPWIKMVALSWINPIKDYNSSIILKKSEIYNIIKKVLNDKFKFSFELYPNYFWIPYCIVDLNDFKHIDLNDFNNEWLYENIKVAKCKNCLFYDKCKWINKLYLEKYGSDEFTPII